MAIKSVNDLSNSINSPTDLITDQLGEHAAILSTEVAVRFQKRHSHILRDIERLRSILPKDFTATNFGVSYNEVHIGNGAVRKDKSYLLTRDAFSLLVMGMTG